MSLGALSSHRRCARVPAMVQGTVEGTMKHTSQRNWVRQVLAVVLATGLPLSSAQAGQNAGESSQSLQWKMKYVEGAGPQAIRRNCQVTFEGEELICEAKKKVLLSIPLASIYEVASYNNRERHPLKAGLRTAGAFPSAILSSPSGDPQGDAALLT